MRVKIAEHSGFCFGVKRAINIAEETLLKTKKHKNIYSLGPIIHNPQVVEGLFKRGLCAVKGIANIRESTVLISSHGAPKDIIKKLKNKDIKLIDATCPFVKYAHDIVKNLKKDGYDIIIIGDKKHPEVKALLSLAGNARVGNRVKPKAKIGVVSQTTQKKDNYLKGIQDLLKKDFSEVRIFNTICNDALHRQASCRRLLKECDNMIIVGGKNSANTRRLWEICKESGVDTYHIEVDSELKKDWFNKKECVGIVSGASTPDSMVKKVAKKIQSFE